LLKWYRRHRRQLPWRNTADPYAIWVSEVMLQQTQVATATPYWKRFLEVFPTVATLAAADEKVVLSAWSGLGYYSRARNLHRAAQEVVAKWNGELPRSADSLRTLPGFGRYTAGAVASIAFGEPAPVLDGNVARVFSRFFAVEGIPGDKHREAQLWAMAEEWVSRSNPGDWNQALMELGATVCRPEKPSCLLCPVRNHCAALASGRVDELPPPKPRPPRQQLDWTVALWKKNGKVLLARRASQGLFGGLWELPSFPTEPDGPDRTLKNALGAAAEGATLLGIVQRTLTHRELLLRVFELHGGAPKRLAAYEETTWVAPDETQALGISAAMRKALAFELPDPPRNGPQRGTDHELFAPVTARRRLKKRTVPNR
jgi:A/G-specific adenine glycosylase